MEATLYAKILSDRSITDLKKLKYKYPEMDVNELVELFKASLYTPIPLLDSGGNDVVYMDNITRIRMNAVRMLLAPRSPGSGFGLSAMENEIASTLTIENIDFDRTSIRRILQGYAPTDEKENRIYGIKKGLDYISKPSNAITEESVYDLYNMAIGQYLPGEDKLNPGELYRHDSVFVMGQKIEHVGLHHSKLTGYMRRLISFAEQDSPMNDLLKAAAIHFYIAYLHPYFDGNGRMARFMHLWYLCRQGYSSALFIPFSSYIEQSRNSYYNAFTLTEENAKISNVLDITPFLAYFIEHVYDKLISPAPQSDAFTVFAQALESGSITGKEKELWYFVLSAYGDGEFSTKQLERDFRNAAYATIRGFVLKFTELKLLSAHKYVNRVKYSADLNGVDNAHG